MLAQLLKQLLRLAHCLFKWHLQWPLMLPLSQKQSNSRTMRTAFRKITMRIILYTDAASLQNKMHELSSRAAISSPEVLAISKTWGRERGKEQMRAKWCQTGRRRVRKHRANGIHGGVVLLVKDTIPAVIHLSLWYSRKRCRGPWHRPSWISSDWHLCISPPTPG